MPLTPYEQQLAARGLLRTHVSFPGGMSDDQLKQARQPAGEADIAYNMALNGRNPDGSPATDPVNAAAIAALKAKRDEARAAYKKTEDANRVTVLGNEEVSPDTASLISELHGQGLIPGGTVGLREAKQAIASNKRFEDKRNSVLADQKARMDDIKKSDDIFTQRRDAKDLEYYKLDAPARAASVAYERGEPDRALSRDLVAAQIENEKAKLELDTQARARAADEYQSPADKMDFSIYARLGEAASMGNPVALRKLRELRAANPKLPDPARFDPGAQTVLEHPTIKAGLDGIRALLETNNWSLNPDEFRQGITKAQALVDSAGGYGPEVAKAIRNIVDEVAGKLMWEPSGLTQFRTWADKLSDRAMDDAKYNGVSP